MICDRLYSHFTKHKTTRIGSSTTHSIHKVQGSSFINGPRLSFAVYNLLRACTALMMAAYESAFNDAPPTRKPSMSGCAINSSQFAGFTDPPYISRMALDTSSDTLSLNHFLNVACVVCALSLSQATPVPMAQTGSYAITILLHADLSSPTPAAMAASDLKHTLPSR